MTGFSKLLIIGNSTKKSLTQLTKSQLFTKTAATNNTQLFLANKNLNANNILFTQIRGSHGRQLFIRPGLFYTKKFWDIIHLHLSIALIPLGLFIFYNNVFIGPAELKEIPDDYEPRYWEYYKHPIKRFLAKHYYECPEKVFELTLHNLYVEQCTIKMRRLEQKVKSLMKERQDYKGWYYVPVSKEPSEYAKDYERLNKLKGYSNNSGGKLD